jgi:hypothetical protein
VRCKTNLFGLQELVRPFHVFGYLRVRTGSSATLDRLRSLERSHAAFKSKEVHGNLLDGHFGVQEENLRAIGTPAQGSKCVWIYRVL